jgi:two-component sensor histidine kinase
MREEKGKQGRIFRPSRLPYQIFFLGWMTVPVFVLLSLERTPVAVLRAEFLSVDTAAIAFRAGALFLPLMFTAMGYLVLRRERFLAEAVVAEKKIGKKHEQLQANYERLSQKLAELQQAESERAEDPDAVTAVHRRARGNLAIVAGLLDLHAQQTQDPDLRDSFVEDRRRLKALALCHETLAQSGDPLRADFKDYAKALGEELVGALSPDRKVALALDMAAFPLGMEQLAPLGLVLHELLSNALRHAFLGIENPSITIRLEHEGSGEAVLRVLDNGIGMPQDLDVSYLSTVGLKLAKRLAGQMHGRIEMSGSAAGTAITVFFPYKG